MKLKPKIPFHEGLFRFSVAQLLMALAVMFVVSPFAENLRYGEFVEAIVFSVMLLAAMNAIGGRHRTLIAGALLVTPALVTRWLNHLYPGFLPIGPGDIAVVVFVSFVIWHLLRFVMSAPTVTAEVLCAALSIYLLFAVAWAFLYTLLASLDPNAFGFTIASEAGQKMTGFTALYFSVAILTAMALGDIMPISNVARMMTLVEATAGIFYVTVLIARLVGLYSSGKTADQS